MNQYIDKKDLEIISCLRNNARTPLTTISKTTKVPISTIHDKLKLQKIHALKKNVALIDFNKIGFNCITKIFVKTEKETKLKLRQHLLNHTNVNSLFQVNNGFDYFCEGIFKNLREVEEFIDELDNKFTIKDKQVYYVLEEISRENFLSNPDHIYTALRN
ncbi:Lrp/AsnC family transcriptional regulator [Candidatus Woesearchaeota archaeon]|jgi:DNA-binding Lrp family transcriptional regulator|nr:Lrp/AsnC family transcriptional regulator [Candidatus Woesearchaeota archaeon]